MFADIGPKTHVCMYAYIPHQLFLHAQKPRLQTCIESGPAPNI